MPPESPATSSSPVPPIGLIAGGGRLPMLTAKGIHAAGRRVVCVGLADQYDPALPSLCDHFDRAGIIRIGRWIRLLRRRGVSEAVMVGGLRKARMFEPLRLVRQMPDWRAAKLWYRVLRHDRRTQTLLRAVADELSLNGIELVDTTRYIPEFMAEPGVMTRRQPTREQMADVEFGWPILMRLSDIDIGQAIAVREREIVAVEAIEGTDAMIQRAGELCRIGGWTLIKAARPGHDMRFDVPTVGRTTIENLHRHGGRCLVVQAGKVILADKPQVIALADELGVAIVGR